MTAFGEGCWSRNNRCVRCVVKIDSVCSKTLSQLKEQKTTNWVRISNRVVRIFGLINFMVVISEIHLSRILILNWLVFWLEPHFFVPIGRLSRTWWRSTKRASSPTTSPTGLFLLEVTPRGQKRIALAHQRTSDGKHRFPACLAGNSLSDFPPNSTG